MFNFLAYKTTVVFKQNRKREKEEIGGSKERNFKHSVSASSISAAQVPT